MSTQLTYTVEERIKFSEVDAMGILWHGHYLRLFEEGREHFGLQHGIDYLNIHREGFFTPIVKSNVNHIAPLQYGDTAIITAKYVYSPAAKIIFDYEIHSKNTQRLCATGRTEQVFLNSDYQLHLTNPTIYELWKQKHFANE
jgi:acyl-CoA thioester hydrolase